MNGHNTEELIRLTRQYKITIDKLNLLDDRLAREIKIDENPESMILHGKKLTVKCKGNCYVNRLITESKIEYETGKGKKSINKMFNNLKVNTINNWKCPIPNINVEDIYVKEFVNGISMQKLQKETLRISGDQNVSGNFSQQ